MIIYTNMTRSIRWRRSWIKMLLLFFLRTSMKQFWFSLSLRNAMNSTLQNRDIRDNQWNASLFLCRRTSFQKRVNRICLSAPLHAPPAPAEQVPSRTSSPSFGAFTPQSVKQLHSLSTSLHVLFFSLSFSNISLNAAAATSPECRMHVRVRSSARAQRLAQVAAKPSATRCLTSLLFLNAPNFW